MREEAPQVHPCLPVRPRQEEGDRAVLSPSAPRSPGPARPPPGSPLKPTAPAPSPGPAAPLHPAASLSACRRVSAPSLTPCSRLSPGPGGRCPRRGRPLRRPEPTWCCCRCCPAASASPPSPAAGGTGGRGEREEAAGVAQPPPPQARRAAVSRERRGHAPSSRRQPGAGGTTAGGMGGREEGSTGKGRGRARSRAGEEHGRFPAGRRSRSGSGRSAALPPGEGGRHASRVCVCSPRGTWALPRGTPAHTCGAERSTPRRKGGGGRDAGSKATTPMAPLLLSPRSPRHLVRPAARHAGTAGRQRGPGAGAVGGRRGRGVGAVVARPLSAAARSARLHPSWSRARERGEEGTPSFHFGTNRIVLSRPTGPQAPAAGICGERWKRSPVSGGPLGRTKPIAAI